MLLLPLSPVCWDCRYEPRCWPERSLPHPASLCCLTLLFPFASTLPGFVMDLCPFHYAMSLWEQKLWRFQLPLTPKPSMLLGRSVELHEESGDGGGTAQQWWLYSATFSFESLQSLLKTLLWDSTCTCQANSFLVLCHIGLFSMLFLISET